MKVMSRALVSRLLVASALLGAAAAAAVWTVKLRLPAPGRLVQGLLLHQGGRACAAPSSPEALKHQLQAPLDRTLELRLEGKPLFSASPRQLGAQGNSDEVATAARAIARTGSWWQRFDEATQAREGHVSLAAPWVLPVDPLAKRLLPIKDRYDRAPRSARWDFAKQAATPHRDGRSLDVYGTAQAYQRAVHAGASSMEVVVTRRAPRATQALVATLDRSTVVSDYTTRFGFVGNQVGRAQNVARAAAGIDGLVMMPGEVMSFNSLVGPRSTDNGFAHAGEIYKGEMRMGVGGGTCQVASTFHAAAYMGGLDVVQRSPHSRPSGYIGVGLDATVAYPHVDLRMRNPFDFPILVRASAKKGVMRVVLYGKARPATVDFSASTVGIKRYKRKVRVAHWLAEGKVFRKQKGRRGITIEKVRRIHHSDGSTRVETTTDVYPPTNEVYYVAPGTDTDTALPPLPADASG